MAAVTLVYENTEKTQDVRQLVFSLTVDHLEVREAFEGKKSIVASLTGDEMRNFFKMMKSAEEKRAAPG